MFAQVYITTKGMSVPYDDGPTTSMMSRKGGGDERIENGFVVRLLCFCFVATLYLCVQFLAFRITFITQPPFKKKIHEYDIQRSTIYTAKCCFLRVRINVLHKIYCFG